MVVVNQKRRRTKRNRRIGNLLNKTFLCIILVVLGLGIYKSYDIVVAKEVPLLQIQENNQSLLSNEDTVAWNLILVNRDNYLPADYQVELTKLSNGKSVDARIYPDLQRMFDDARKENVFPVVRDGYRTQKEQEQLMKDKIKAFELDGYSESEAKELAREWVAVPGTSEHQMGIAIDINADNARSTNESVYEWLAKNSYKYGFILRYPADKVEITGIQFEPWHYRYVGEEAAEEIYLQGVCLEEYLENAK